jgi:hypothetical protein
MYVLIILLLLIYFVFNTPIYESFHDVIPYNIVWDIDKCFDGKCVMDKSYKCYKYCDNVQASEAKQKCQLECLNIGDEMFDNLKYQNYTWPLNKTNILFNKYTILNNTGDYVNISK